MKDDIITVIQREALDEEGEAILGRIEQEITLVANALHETSSHLRSCALRGRLLRAARMLRIMMMQYTHLRQLKIRRLYHIWYYVPAE